MMAEAASSAVRPHRAHASMPAKKNFSLLVLPHPHVLADRGKGSKLGARASRSRRAGQGGQLSGCLLAAVVLVAVLRQSAKAAVAADCGCREVVLKATAPESPRLLLPRR